MKKSILYFLLIFFSFSISGCDNFLDIEPEGKVIPKTLEDFRGLITSGYNAYPRHKSLATLRTDELNLDSYSYDFLTYRDIYIWKDMNQDPNTTPFQWQHFYNVIFYTNHIINEGVKTIPDSAEKDQLLGEAYALRAYAYFDLVNLYAKPYTKSTASTEKAVPLALEIDLEKILAPETTEVIYSQILSDIASSKIFLNKDTQTVGFNYRFSKVAVFALEARVYLYKNEWQKALDAVKTTLTYKNELVDLNTDLSLPNRYDSVESILALEDVYTAAQRTSTSASNDLINRYDPVNDLRFSIAFEKSGSEYKIIKGGNERNFKCSFRTAELYLIKSEALFQLNNISESKEVLLTLMKKRYTPAGFTSLDATVQAMSAEDFYTMIFDERARELAVEGHRWFDLRRSTQKEITHELEGKSYILNQNDIRYTIPYPTNAKLNNPNL